MNKFKNLHTHTEYSLNDSVIRIPQLVKTLKEYKQDTCAITDHSSCAGWIEFNQECEKNNKNSIKNINIYYHIHCNMQHIRLHICTYNTKTRHKKCK